MSICKKCNGNGYIYTNAFGTNGKLRCDVCGGGGEIITNAELIKPTREKTNEEWFANLTTEEKAKFIQSKFYMAGYKDGFNESEPISSKDVLNWLKAVHK